MTNDVNKSGVTVEGYSIRMRCSASPQVENEEARMADEEHVLEMRDILWENFIRSGRLSARRAELTMMKRDQKLRAVYDLMERQATINLELVRFLYNEEPYHVNGKIAWIKKLRENLLIGLLEAKRLCEKLIEVGVLIPREEGSGAYKIPHGFDISTKMGMIQAATAYAFVTAPMEQFQAIQDMPRLEVERMLREDGLDV